MKREYRPELEESADLIDAVCQLFDATRVEILVEDNSLYIQVAEDWGDATIHSLLFCLSPRTETDEAELYAEFNDQGNGMFGAQVGTIELSRDLLTVTPRAGSGLTPGRVSYSEDADPASGPTWVSGKRLGRIVARLRCDDGEISSLDQALSQVTQFGVNYRARLKTTDRLQD